MTVALLARAEAAERQAQEMREALGAIVTTTHRPNPTDRTRIDVAPGKHHAFQAAIERAVALCHQPREDVTNG